MQKCWKHLLPLVACVAFALPTFCEAREIEFSGFRLGPLLVDGQVDQGDLFDFTLGLSEELRKAARESEDLSKAIVFLSIGDGSISRGFVTPDFLPTATGEAKKALQSIRVTSNGCNLHEVELKSVPTLYWAIVDTVASERAIARRCVIVSLARALGIEPSEMDGTTNGQLVEKIKRRLEER